MKKLTIRKQTLKDMRTGREYSVNVIEYRMRSGGMQQEAYETEEKFIKRLQELMVKVEPKVMKGIS